MNNSKDSFKKLVWGTLGFFQMFGCAFDISGSEELSTKVSDSTSVKSISFEKDIVPVFSSDIAGSKCTDCHQGSPAIGNLNLNSTQRSSREMFDAIMYGRINKERPEESLILLRPSGVDHRKIFSKGDKDSYELISLWILQGAGFEAPSVNPTPTVSPSPNATPTIPPTFFAAQIHPKLGSCAGCHSGGGRIDLSGSDPVTVCNRIKNFAGAVNTNNARASLLYTKPTQTGVTHGGGRIWSENVEGAILVQWIENRQASCTAN